ncbi:Hypothetical protein SMAX5B_004600, partial [Scophthalmus maximus]
QEVINLTNGHWQRARKEWMGSVRRGRGEQRKGKKAKDDGVLRSEGDGQRWRG